MARGGTRKIDYFTLTIFLVLLGVGLAALASASSDLGKINHDDPFFYLKDQIIFGLGVGALAFLAGLFINYRLYKTLATPIFLASVALLLLLLSPLGIAVGGAQRWIAVGPLTLQPSELLKLTMVLYLAAWLSSERNTTRGKSLSDGLIPFVSIVGFVCLILLFQNSTSAAVIIGFVALLIYFASGARWPFLMVIVLGGSLLVTAFVFSTPYRLERIKGFADPSADVQGSGYQATQALTVIGSGGLFGVGYGQSTAKNFLPERMGDSIFAIIAEELGFVGSMVVIFLYTAFVIRGAMLANKIRDRFGRLVMVGFTAVIGTQTLIHIASTVGSIPTTGVPLPFVSYGNFSLVVFMAMVGIMLNVQRNS